MGEGGRSKEPQLDKIALAAALLVQSAVAVSFFIGILRRLKKVAGCTQALWTQK
jgi:hypothetical protein